MIERIFGVVKCQFHVLQTPLEYNMDIQARIPTALCAIHNFVRQYDPDAFFDSELTEGDLSAELGGDELGVLGDGPVDAAERRQADQRHDNIAQEMWEDYQQGLACRGIEVS